VKRTMPVDLEGHEGDFEIEVDLQQQPPPLRLKDKHVLVSLQVLEELKTQQFDVPVKASDIEVVRNAVQTISLPTWAEICDKSNPGCSAAWKATVGKAIGVQ